ncbi:MATE family efflux transporter [Myxococcota bacterium]|nr:MATE family efflux transporter [Myxococcota bacterium]
MTGAQDEEDLQHPVPSREGWWRSLRERDHTRGNLLVSVLVLSAPAVATGLLGVGAFQMVDLAFLATLGDDQVAAAGASNQTLRQVFQMLIMGLSVGSQMMIARQIGAFRVDQAEHTAGQSFLIGGGLAGVAAIVGALFPEPLISLIARDPEVIAFGTIYVRIIFTTLAATVAVQVFGAVLGGAGDTTTPMVISFVVTLASIAAEWVLAFGHLGFPAMGIAGIGLGAAVGNACGVVLAMWALMTGRCRVHLRRRHFIPDPGAMRQLISVSWQPAFHMVARSLMLVFFMTLSGRLGGDVQAAYTIGLRIEMTVIMITFAVANACATLVGQNLGAHNVGRAWQSVRVSAAVAMVTLWPLAITLYLARDVIAGSFTSDPGVAAIASEYLVYSSAILSFYGLYFVAFRTLQAAGDMNSPMYISIGAAVFLGAPLGYYLTFSTDLGTTGMWVANLVYAIANTMMMVGWLLTGRWTRSHEPPSAG